MIEEGIEPLRELVLRYSICSDTSDPIDAGMLPVRELRDNTRYLSPVSELIEGGIVPPRELVSSNSVCSDTSDPIDAGMLPVREF